MKLRSPGDPIKLTYALRDLRDDLTPKQIAFAEHLVAQENRWTATQCAIRAGYSEKTARFKASQLQSSKEFPKVAEYISALRDDLWNKYKVSPTSHFRRLHDIGLKAEELEKPDLRTALAAEVSRGKAAGMYEKKVKVNTKTIDSLSLDQVNEMLNNLKVIESVEENATKTIQSDDQPIQSDNSLPE
jgi:phage terminase small subunit